MFKDYNKFKLKLQVGLLLFSCATRSAPIAAAPIPIHSYEFQGNLQDTGLGGVDIQAEGGTVGIEYFEFDPMYPGDYNEGLTLTNPAITNPGVYSIEMRIKYERLRNETPPGTYGPDQSWIKTIDFTDGQESYGLYVEDNIRWEGPGEEGIIEFIASTGTPGGFHYPGVSPLSTVLADTWFHVVVTRESSGLFTCFVDGAQAFDFVDEQDDAVIDAPSGTLRFFQPDEQAILQYDVYEVTKGAIDYLRIYDEALTPQEALELFEGPIPGDFDGNGAVDNSDLVQWKGDFGNNGNSDADGDGDSDGNDFLIWQRNFIGNSTVEAITVPEPTSLMSIAFALLLSVLHRKREPTLKLR